MIKPELVTLESTVGSWLEVKFSRPHSVLSWAIIGGGWTQASIVTWQHVTPHELHEDLDPVQYFQEKLAQRHRGKDVIGFLTGASLRNYSESLAFDSEVNEEMWVRCIVTMGLRNAVRIGDPPSFRPIKIGTINILLQTSLPLSQLASIEALSLVTEARTLAVLEGKILSMNSTDFATGTGTDCIAIASPVAEDGIPYAGKHTVLGHLIGTAAYQAVSHGVKCWKATYLHIEERSERRFVETEPEIKPEIEKDTLSHSTC